MLGHGDRFARWGSQEPVALRFHISRCVIWCSRVFGENTDSKTLHLPRRRCLSLVLLSAFKREERRRGSTVVHPCLALTQGAEIPNPKYFVKPIIPRRYGRPPPRISSMTASRSTPRSRTAHREAFPPDPRLLCGRVGVGPWCRFGTGLFVLE